MRYVVTGGSGFLGSHLVSRLHSENKDVVIVDKISNHVNLNLIKYNSNTKYYFADISDPTIMLKIIQKDDIVFHLAAQSHVDTSFQSPIETIKTNVLGTQSVLNACLKNFSKKLIITSTDEVYGSNDNIPNLKLLDPTNPYSAAKAAADMIANSYRHMYKNFDFAILRSNNIIGTGQFILNIVPKFSCLGILGKKMTLHGKGTSLRRYLWVNDVVEALMLLAHNDTKEYIYNIGHDKSYTNLEVANLIGKYLNLSDFISYEQDRVYNDSIYPCDYSAINEELGWSFSKNLPEVLPSIIDWYKEHISNFKKFL
jgi:dTDP-glucose 4,6-dehydratase